MTVTVEVYEATAPSVSLGTITKASGWSFSLIGNGAGNGSFDVPLDDPNYALLQPGRLARIAHDGVDVAELLLGVPSTTRKRARDAEHPTRGPSASWSGPGSLIVVGSDQRGGAIVYPEYGLDRTSVSPRYFGAMSVDYDPVEPARWATEPWSAGEQGNPDPNLPALAGFPEGWDLIDPTAEWIGPYEPTLGPNGLSHPAPWSWWTRRQLPIPDEGNGAIEARVFASFDGYGEVWLDGAIILRTEEAGAFRKVYTADVLLEPGDHVILARIHNRETGPNADNPSLFILNVSRITSDGLLGTALIRTHSDPLASSQWETYWHETPPGYLAGRLVNRLLDEAEDRATDAGQTSPIAAVTRDYSDTLDADGETWTVEQIVPLNVGSTTLWCLAQIEQLMRVDYAMHPGLVLALYQDRGTDLSGTVAFVDGSDVIEATYGGTLATSNTFLIETGDGFAEEAAPAAVVRLESGVSFGTAIYENALVDWLAQAYEDLATDQHDAVVTIDGSGIRPQVDFAVGDIIGGPDAAGAASSWEVLSIVGRADPNDEGNLLYTLILREV